MFCFIFQYDASSTVIINEVKVTSVTITVTYTDGPITIKELEIFACFGGE